MENSSSGSVRRHLLPCLIVLALLPAASADTVTTFDVSGNAENVTNGSLGSCAAKASCAYTGTISVDVTKGQVEGADITLPGLPAFQFLINSFEEMFPSNWTISVDNPSLEVVTLDFNTNQKPPSLVGFDGGDISTLRVDDSNDQPLYGSLAGTITPAVTTPTPEPSLRGLLAVGLVAGFGIVAWRKRKQLA